MADYELEALSLSELKKMPQRRRQGDLHLWGSAEGGSPCQGGSSRPGTGLLPGRTCRHGDENLPRASRGEILASWEPGAHLVRPGKETAVVFGSPGSRQNSWGGGNWV